MTSVADHPRGAGASGAAAHAVEDELPGWPPGRTWGLAKHVAAVLGCHRQTVYKMAAAGLIRSREHGLRSIRFHRDEVLRLVRSRGVGELLEGTYGEGPAPLARVLALLEALTPAELDRVSLEAIRRRMEASREPGRLAVVRGGRR